MQVLYDGILFSFSVPSSLLDVSQDLLSAFLFFQDAVLELILVFLVNQALLLDQLFQTEILFSELDGSLSILFHNQLLVLVLSTHLKRSISIEKLVLGLDVCSLAFVIVVKEHSSLVVLVVDLFEVTVLATTSALLLL